MQTVETIRLLIAGPPLPEMWSLVQSLEQQESIVVVGETFDSSRVVEVARLRTPHVILLRTRGTESALDAILMILTQAPDIKLLVFANSFSAESTSLMVVNGARGVLGVRESCAQAMRAISAVHGGEIWCPRVILSQIIQVSSRRTIQTAALSKRFTNLTEREREVVTLSECGLSNKEIASQLGISFMTVKTHLHNVFGKLNVNRRQKLHRTVDGTVVPANSALPGHF